MEMISIIIPCKNEEKYIAICLESVINNNYPKEFIEVIVVDGNSTDSTQNIIWQYVKKNKFIHLLLNNNETVPYALNLAIKKATGNYIFRLDAHSKIPNNYFTELIKWCKKLGADNVGALCNTEVKNTKAKAISIKKVLSSKFGVGNSYFRTGIDEIKEVDTVPFGCFPKEIFNKIGYFDFRLKRNQDIEFNKRIKRFGGKIYLIPTLHFTYFARETYLELAKNNFSNGLWIILTVYITKRLDSLSLRHFVPCIFLSSLIFPTLAAIWLPVTSFISLFSLTLYLLILFIISIINSGKETTFYYIFISYLVLHFSYGFGSIVGLACLGILFRKKNEK